MALLILVKFFSVTVSTIPGPEGYKIWCFSFPPKQSGSQLLQYALYIYVKIINNFAGVTSSLNAELTNL